MKRYLVAALLLCVAAFGQLHAQSCTGPLTVTVEGSTEGNPLIASGTPTQPDCNAASGPLTGAIAIDVSGGSPAYTFNWTKDGVAYSTDEDLTGLGAGTYALTITDTKGCSAELSFDIIEPTPVDVVGTTTDLDCHSANGSPTGAIDITASGGAGLIEADYTYAWTTSDGSGLNATAADQTGLSAGTYTVVVTDANGCTDSETFTLTEPAEMTIASTAVDLSCNAASGPADGSIDITVTGGQGTVEGDYTYAWTTSDGSGLNATAADQTGLSAGTYTVVVTDANGCTVTDTWTLTEPTPVAVTEVLTDLSCHANSGVADGEIEITASGGQGSAQGDYTYAWTTSDGSGLVPTDDDQTGLSAGTYTVVITDSNGCTVTATYTLTQPDEVVISATPVDLDCNVSSGVPTGAIDVTVVGGQGTVEGDYTYTWSTSDGSGLVNGVADQTGLSAGTYTLLVEDANGCTDESTWTLTEPTPVDVTAVTTDLSCHAANGPADGAIDISVTGGQGASEGDYTYAWVTSDGTGLVANVADQTGLSAGTYSVTVTDVNGCTVEATYTLTQPPVVQIFAGATDLSCHDANGAPDGEITVTAAGGQGSQQSDYTFTWSTSDGSGLVAGQANQTGLTAGTYYLTVSDANNCTIEASYTLTQPQEMVVSGVQTNLSCNAASGAADGTIDITVAGGQGTQENDYDYAWSTTDGSGLNATYADQTGLSAGTYTVVITDANGCTVTESWTLTEPTPVACTLDSPIVGVGGTHILCAGETGTIVVNASGGNGPYTYSLDGTTFQTDPTFTVLAGTYTVTTMDANGCTSTCTITLTEPDPLTAGTCVTDDECQVGQGEIEVEASGGVGPYTVTWTSPTGGTLDQSEQTIPAPTGSVTFTGAQGGETYIFTVTDANGCIIGG